MNRVLFAFFGASEIQIAAQQVRNGQVGLQDLRQHLLIELFLEGFGAVEDGIGVSVLGVEVRDYLGTLLILEPCVIVDAAVVVDDVLDGVAPGDRRLGV